MKQGNKKDGFAVIEALLILVILGIVGFTGWFVWHSKQNANKNYDSSSKSSQPGSTPKSSSKNSKKQTPAPPPQQYLVIKEWGVKIPLSADITGAYYTISNSSAPEEIVYLKETGFDNTKNSGGTSCKGTYEPGMFAMARVPKADINKIEDAQGEQSALLAGGESLVMPGYYDSGTPANQAYPGCYYLDANSSTSDNNILTFWNTKKNAFKAAFALLQKS